MLKMRYCARTVYCSMVGCYLANGNTVVRDFDEKSVLPVDFLPITACSICYTQTKRSAADTVSMHVCMVFMALLYDTLDETGLTV